MAKKQIKKERGKERKRKETKTEFKNIFHPLVKEGLPIWVRIVTGIIVILTIVAMAFGDFMEIISIFIGLFILLYCSKKCFELALEIKKSTTLAYIIGILFSLLGLLDYWIYYKMIKAKVKKWIMIVSLIIISIILLLVYLALLFMSYSPA